MHPGFLSRAVAVLALLAAACSAPPEPAGMQRSAVIGGELTGTAHAGVVYVSSEVRNLSGVPLSKVGSGSVVAPNLVLTALHVVSRNPSDVPFTCDDMGHEISGSDGSLLGPTVEPQKVTIYAGQVPGAEPVARGVRIVSTGSSTLCQNDIAFVVLDTPVELPAYPIHRGSAAELGATLTVVGYGTGQSPEPQPVRSEREVSVVDVGQWIRTFTVSEGPCEGDSGGPALAEDGELVGVFSTVATDCKGPNAAAKYTDVSYFQPLVEEAFEAADAGSPWSNGTGGDAGEAGEAGRAGDPGQGGSGAAEAGAPAGGSDADTNGDDSGCTLRRRGQGGAPSTLLVTLVGGYLLCRGVGRSRRSCALR